MTNEKDREEARRKAWEFARKVHKAFSIYTPKLPVDIVIEHDEIIRAEAVKAETLDSVGPSEYWHLADQLRHSPLSNEANAEYLRRRDASIRSAERERCKRRAMAFLDNLGPDQEWSVNDLYHALLTDDQEAEVIEMPGEAPPVVVFRLFEKRSGVTTDVNDHQATNEEKPEREETLQEYLDRLDGVAIDLEHGSN